MVKPFSAVLNSAWIFFAGVTMYTPLQASESETFNFAKDIVDNGGIVINCALAETCNRGDCSAMDGTVEIALSAVAETQLKLDTNEAVAVSGTWIEPARHSNVTGVQLGRVATLIATGFGDAILVASVDLKTMEINSSEHLSTAFGTSNQYGSCEVVN